MYAEIALPDTDHKTFTYRIPESLKGVIRAGMPVVVPLRNTFALGVVISIDPTTNLPKSKLKEISGRLDPIYDFGKNHFELLRWLSEYYLCPIGDVFRAAYPPGLLGRPKFKLVAGEIVPKEPRARFIYDKIKSRPVGFSFKKGKPILAGVKNLQINRLIKDGYLLLAADIKSHRSAMRLMASLNPEYRRQDSIGHDANIIRLISLIESSAGCLSVKELIGFGFSRQFINRLSKEGIISIAAKSEEAIIAPTSSTPIKVVLNPDQQKTATALQKAIISNSGDTFLLFGITGSGKTQVYIEAARQALADGRSVLILLPEISLTPQAIRRFSESLDCSIGVWHSKISAGQRTDLFIKAKTGKVRVVLGVRSAVFVPLSNLGLIIIDEEQDDSYKQSDPAPRYNARDVALMRAKLEKAVTVLGSATPSLESFYNAATGKFKLLRLPSRYDGGSLPQPFAIDLRKAEVEQKYWPLSEPFIERVCRVVADEHQVVLLLNRRGYAGILMCKSCGWVALCPDCRVAMTYHRPVTQMRCHFCGQAQAAPDICPTCSGAEFDYRGIGTQKLEELLVEILGEKGIIRMDSDTTSRKGALEKIIAAFELGDVPVLLGTKMVAKGHHFPGVGLVGVVLADAGLHLPDFRASEKVFQLLVQAAGRAGRSAQFANGGEFVVQTYNPTSSILEFAAGQDYEVFYNRELGFRQELGYPPFGKIIRIVFSGEDDSLTRWAARQAAKDCATKMRIGKVLGPAPTGVFRLGKAYHYQVLLKGKFSSDFKIWLKQLAWERHPKRAKGVSIKIDVDPREMI